MQVQVYLNIAQIILGVVLIALILFEVQSSGLGGIFGGSQTGMVRKRRGAELLLFRLTIGAAVLFFVVAIVSVLVVGY